MGDFTGFTFGGVKSSDLGIIRVSGGDRYDEELHPEIKDRTAEVPGLHGEYYFGSDFGTKTFDIEFAFDSLTEKQFRRIRQIFGTKEIKQLIFDERPYKYYMAKIENPVELSYVCFEEPIRKRYSELYSIGTIDPQTGLSDNSMELPDGIRMVDDGNGNRVREKIDPWVVQEGIQRIYRGEGKIAFKCYFPFAKSTFKVLPTAGEEYYEGMENWAISSGILSEDDRISRDIDTYVGGVIRTYNPGDIEVGFRLYLPQAILNTATTISYEPYNTDVTAALQLNPITLESNEEGVLVDTNNGLVVGVLEMGEDNGNAIYTTSGNLYNNCVDSGTFFHLEPNIINDYSTLQITGGGTGIQIFYDYLYF